MDNTDAPKANRWAWLPEQMPGVAKLLAEKRKTFGTAWINECWKHGVNELQPGWLFAREGALWVGTPWDQQWDDILAAARDYPDRPLLFIRTPEATDASH